VRCDGCKWWDHQGKASSQLALRPGWGVCLMASKASQRVRRKAVAVNVNGYVAYFQTAPDYGCRQYEGDPGPPTFTRGRIPPVVWGEF